MTASTTSASSYSTEYNNREMVRLMQAADTHPEQLRRIIPVRLFEAAVPTTSLDEVADRRKFFRVPKFVTGYGSGMSGMYVLDAAIICGTIDSHATPTAAVKLQAVTDAGVKTTLITTVGTGAGARIDAAKIGTDVGDMDIETEMVTGAATAAAGPITIWLFLTGQIVEFAV